jgi:hypothetical protein
LKSEPQFQQLLCCREDTAQSCHGTLSLVSVWHSVIRHAARVHTKLFAPPAIFAGYLTLAHCATYLTRKVEFRVFSSMVVTLGYSAPLASSRYILVVSSDGIAHRYLALHPEICSISLVLTLNESGVSLEALLDAVRFQRKTNPRNAILDFQDFQDFFISHNLSQVLSSSLPWHR